MWNRVVTFVERVRFVVRRRRIDDETRSELEGHVELLIDRYIRLGMTREDARIAAHRQFGNACWCVRKSTV